jgi:hypothetical protein
VLDSGAGIRGGNAGAPSFERVGTQRFGQEPSSSFSAGRVPRRRRRGALGLNGTLRLLELALTSDAQARERHRLEASVRDLAAAFLANTVLFDSRRWRASSTSWSFFAVAVAEQQVDSRSRSSLAMS